MGKSSMKNIYNKDVTTVGIYQVQCKTGNTSVTWQFIQKFLEVQYHSVVASNFWFNLGQNARIRMQGESWQICVLEVTFPA